MIEDTFFVPVLDWYYVSDLVPLTTYVVTKYVLPYSGPFRLIPCSVRKDTLPFSFYTVIAYRKGVLSRRQYGVGVRPKGPCPLKRFRIDRVLNVEVTGSVTDRVLSSNTLQFIDLVLQLFIHISSRPLLLLLLLPMSNFVFLL